MSKIGNHRVGMQETEDYRFGWESAERGEPNPSWLPMSPPEQERLRNQRMGWCDFHNQEQSA